MYFPTYIMDNFFNDPDGVVKYAGSLDYAPCDESANWPGLRADPSEDFRSKFFEKLMDLALPFTEASMTGKLYFQHIDSDELDSGWIHHDHRSTLAGIVYLSKNSSIKDGTNLYRQVDISKSLYTPEAHTAKNKYFQDVEERETLDVIKEEHNSKYEKTVQVGNVFNRLLMYDASNAHGVPVINNDRLTLVFFLKIYSDWFPVPKVKQGFRL